MSLLRRSGGSPLLQGEWRGIGLVAAALLVAGWWFAWDSTRWPRRERLRPTETKGNALFEELTEIARLESQQEGAGRERAKGLVPLLNSGPSADREYEMVAGTPLRWDDCAVIQCGGGGLGCYSSSISWLRLEATEKGARAVWVGAESNRRYPTFRSEEATLSKGEFLAVVRAVEVFAGVTVKPRPDPQGGVANWNPRGSLRVVGRSGTHYQSKLEPNYMNPTNGVRSDAAWNAVSLLMRSKSMRRFRPTATDREWLHDAFRDTPGGKSDSWSDRCHGILFKGLRDSEGVEMAIQRSPELDSYFHGGRGIRALFQRVFGRE